MLDKDLRELLLKLAGYDLKTALGIETESPSQLVNEYLYRCHKKMNVFELALVHQKERIKAHKEEGE